MSSLFKVIYSPAAKEDLRSITSYILYSLHAPKAAKEVTGAIRSMIRSLNKMPDRFAAVDWEPWASLQMRFVTVGNYVIYYRTSREDAEVSIIRIFYGGRDIRQIVIESDETEA